MKPETSTNLIAAIQWLLDDMEAAGETRSEVGVEYDSVANARRWLEEARKEAA